jgi:exosortase/archaeosortase family protein
MNIERYKHQRLSSIRPFMPLLRRAVVFLVVFVILSGIIGPKIINHGLVERDGFQIYGGSGKALLFGVLAFLLLIYRKKYMPQFTSWRPIQLIWLGLSFLSVWLAWVSVDHLGANSTSLIWIILAHTSIIASVLLAAGGTFGPYNLRLLCKTYKKQLLLAILLAILFGGLLYAIYGLWRVLATIVLHAVKWLLGIIGIHATILLPRTLLLSKFGINIAQYCSGIESVALFTALYGLIGLLDWHRFNHFKFLWIFPLALIILFIFNIFRVFVLVLGGYYINPQIAFSLFHTYAGMIFFIIYSGIFWAISYKWMLNTNLIRSSRS